MKRDKILGGIIAAAMILQTVPVLAAEDSAGTLSVTKSGKIISVSNNGSSLNADDIKVFDKNAIEETGYEVKQDNGNFEIDISGMAESNEDRYLQVGEKYYSFINPYEVSENLSTWRGLSMGDMTEGTSTINSTYDIQLEEGKFTTNSIYSTNADGIKTPQTSQSVAVPSVDYQKYATDSQTVKMRVTLGGDSSGGKSPEIITHLSEVKRPSADKWAYSNWSIVGTGYAVQIEWGTLFVRALKGSTEPWEVSDTGDYTKNTASLDTFSCGYASNPQGTTLWTGETYTEGDTHDITVITETIDGKVRITVKTQKVNEDGTLGEEYTGYYGEIAKFYYEDSAPSSTSGTVAINTWGRMIGDPVVHSITVTNNNADIVKECTDVTQIPQSITSVKKDWDKIAVTFDGKVSPFASDKFTVSDTTGRTYPKTVTFSDKTATVDISGVDGTAGNYILAVKTANGTKQYKFNKSVAFFEDFNVTDNIKLKMFESLSVKDSTVNGEHGFVDGSEQALSVSGNKLQIANRRMYTSKMPTQMSDDSNAWVKFKTKITTEAPAWVWYNSPAVLVNVSDAWRGNINTDGTANAWSGPFYKGYAIFKQGSDMIFRKMDGTTMGHDGQEKTLIKMDSGFTGGTCDEFEIEVKTEIQDGKFVAWAKMTNLTTNLSAEYEYVDENPISTSGKTFICSEGLDVTGTVAPNGVVYPITVEMDDLMMATTDNTIEYVKDNTDLIKEWAEDRTAKTGRDELSFVTLGGSITQGGIWNDAVRSYFESETGKTVNLYNAGIGGTGSSFALLRLQEDVISKNPDIVFLDHSVNDDDLVNTYEGTLRSVPYFETIIRELQSIENPPMIFVVDFTTEAILKTDLRMDKNYNDAVAQFEKGTLKYDFNYDNTHKKEEAVTEKDMLYLFRKAYVGDANKYTDNIAFYPNAVKKDYYNYIADKYDIPQIDLHAFWKKYASITPKTEDKYTGVHENYGNEAYQLTIDFDTMLADYQAFATGTNYADFSAALSETSEEHPMKPLIGDHVHCTTLGKKVYGDFMVKELKNNVEVSFAAQKRLAKPIIGTSFEKTGDIRDVKLTADEVANNARFATTGLTVTNGTASGTYLKDGIELTAGDTDGVFTYTFYGTAFGYYGSADVTPTVTMDGGKYSGDYHTINLLPGTKHEFKLTVPAGKTYKLYRMFSDEESFAGLDSANNSAGESFVTVDLTGVANARAYRSKTEDTDKNMGFQNGMYWKDRINHTNTVEESVGYSFISHDDFVELLDENNLYKTDAAVYDMSSVVNGKRYKALSNYNAKTLGMGNVVTDKIYVLSTKAGEDPKTTNVNVVALKLTYSDGTIVEKTAECQPIATVKGIGQDANPSTFDGLEIRESCIEADKTRELTSIQPLYKKGEVGKIIILGISLKPISGAGELGIYRQELTDESGRTLGASAKELLGKTVTYNASLINTTGAAADYDVIVALYKDDRLVKTEKTDLKLTKNGKVEANITLPAASQEDSTANYTIKTFCWSSVDNLVPVSSAQIMAK